jgi:hypothetical protein
MKRRGSRWGSKSGIGPSPTFGPSCLFNKFVRSADDLASWRTKAAAEDTFLQTDPTATIIRPSIIFGPGDSFFTVSQQTASTTSAASTTARFSRYTR